MDRRRGDVLWKILNLVVNLTFLLLAITIMTILLRNDKYRSDFSDYESQIVELRQEINKVNQSNFVYLEEKINRVAGSSDSYQVSTSQRLDVLVNRMESLEKRYKDRTRIINNNNSTASAIVNE